MEVLAMNGQVIIFNDRKTGRAWFGIANTSVRRTQDGKAVRLVDSAVVPTPANTPESVGTGESHEKQP